MLRVNLLATKAARKHDTAKHELFGAIGLLVALLIGIVVANHVMSSKIDDLRSRISTVKKEIDQLKQEVVKVEEFKKKAETLESKIKVIKGLQQKRIGPAKMLDDLATILTAEPKVWLTQLTEENGNLTLEGGAMEHENISAFQLALERLPGQFQNVKLTLVSAAKEKQDTYLKWRIVCKTKYRSG